MTQAPSLLWRDTDTRATAPADPVMIEDLNLDRVFAAITIPGSSESIGHLLRTPLQHSADVGFRQKVFEDLSAPSLRAQLEAFSQSMAEIRHRLAELPTVDHEILRSRLRVDISHYYCRTVLSLREALEGARLDSPGLQSWRQYVNAYLTRAEFEELVSGCTQVLTDLAEVRYTMRIDEQRITIEKAFDGPDYTAAVERLFEPIAGGVPAPARRGGPADTRVHPVEERILDELAQLFPLPFRRMVEHAGTGGHFVDPVIDRVDEELRFFLSYLRLVDELSSRGMDFCLPEITDHFDGVQVQGAYDIALAAKRSGTGEMPVANDYHLIDGERVIVVTGPNQGGKSTFARMFGQVAYLATLGCPVPARRARIMLVDNISTHFERREHAADAAGMLQSELIAIQETLELSTDRTLIILNESFSSTTTSDAQRIGEQILRKISERQSITLFVTFLDELSRMDGIVSMVAGVGDDPLLRTFRLERKPADGRAHAVALAHQFDLSYEAITRKVPR
ncbi:hypothetical protein ACFXPS_38465 [Nocardia sp. NPDC059091]|uniref:MutS-related protein n=1 Tax=unclassified Nocardia TaxID=2637762 RepID=UPI00368F9F61